MDLINGSVILADAGLSDVIASTDNSTSENNNTTVPTNTTENPFLTGLKHTYHTQNVALAIFLLVLSCLFAILLAALLVVLVRFILRKCFIGRTKTRRKKPTAVYADEIPGLKVDRTSSTHSAWLNYSIEYKLKTQQLMVGVIQSNGVISHSDNVQPQFYVTLSCEHVDQSTGYIRIWGKVEKTKLAHLSAGICSWSELFSFVVPEREMSNTRLSFRLTELIPNGRDYDFGLLVVALKDEDMTEYVGNVLEKTGTFTDPTRIDTHHGELCVGMAYYPREEKLDVHVLEASQLRLPKKPKQTERGHIYVAVSMRTKKHVLKKYDTEKRSDLESPYFNQKFTFKLKEDQKADAYIYCSIKYTSGLTGKQHLGFVWIGSNSPQNVGTKQWEETLKYPAKVHILWHPVMMRDK